MSNAARAADEVISSNAFCWKTFTDWAFLLAAISPDFWKRSISPRSFLRSASRSARIASGGVRSGTEKFGEFGSDSTTSGATAAPRYAEPALACIRGRQTYGGTEPRGPSLRAMIDPCAGRWLLGLRVGLNPATG